jgi:dimethylargininase
MNAKPPLMANRDRLGLLNPFTHALARRPAPTFAQGITTRSALGVPTYEETLAQHDAYVEALREAGLEVMVLEPDPQYPDGHFVEDPAVIFGDTAFICRPATVNRRGEEVAIADALSHLTRVYATGDATIEGGDVLFCRDRVLIGISRRTNRVGAEQLKHAIRDRLGDVRVDFVPFTGVLHLKTGLTELTPGVLLHDPLMRLDSEIKFAEVVTLPRAEGYAASVLPINNNTVIIADGFPTVRDLAEKYYPHVVALPMSEIEKMDGGLTCLSLRY